MGEAGTSGSYVMSTRGRTLEQEGFVHFSTRDRLPRVAAFVYGDYEAPTTWWWWSWTRPDWTSR